MPEGVHAGLYCRECVDLALLAVEDGLVGSERGAGVPTEVQVRRGLDCHGMFPFVFGQSWFTPTQLTVCDS